MVRASGVPDFVAEIGEQLAWLGAALQPSPHTAEPSYCTPEVEVIGGAGSTTLHCQINFKCKSIWKLAEAINGQCWHSMFNGPVIVRGFPIARRMGLSSGSGLETTLDILVALSRARYIDTFNSKIFIKGFSSMLVPTQRDGNTLLWHLLFTESPDEHISYLDCRMEYAEIDMVGLEQVRHIVGWCAVADCTVGRFNAHTTLTGQLTD